MGRRANQGRIRGQLATGNRRTAGRAQTVGQCDGRINRYIAIIGHHDGIGQNIILVKDAGVIGADKSFLNGQRRRLNRCDRGAITGRLDWIAIKHGIRSCDIGDLAGVNRGLICRPCMFANHLSPGGQRRGATGQTITDLIVINSDRRGGRDVAAVGDNIFKNNRIPDRPIGRWRCGFHPLGQGQRGLLIGPNCFCGRGRCHRNKGRIAGILRDNWLDQ